MSRQFTQIHLEELPIPTLLENLSFEEIFHARLNEFLSLSPQYNATVETDPVYILLQEAAYRELIVRQRVNDACKGVMLAYAQGSDLDQIAAIFGVNRLDSEPDHRLRYRTQIALEGYTTAGSEGSYVFWSMSSSSDVKDVDVSSPSPGQVVITVLSSEGDGTPSQELLNQVLKTVNADEVRPLSDFVFVQAPDVVRYSVHAQIFTYQGPDPTVVREHAIDNITQYVSDNHLLGRDIFLSGVYAALHQPGVQRVVLSQPLSDIIVSKTQVAFCESIEIVIGETTDE